MEDSQQFEEMLNSLSEEEVKQYCRENGIPYDVIKKNQSFINCARGIDEINES